MITEEEITKLGFKRIAIYRDGGTIDLQFKDTTLLVTYRGNNIMTPSNIIDFKKLSKYPFGFELLDKVEINDIDTFEKEVIKILDTKEIKLASSL